MLIKFHFYNEDREMGEDYFHDLSEEEIRIAVADAMAEKYIVFKGLTKTTEEAKAIKTQFRAMFEAETAIINIDTDDEDVLNIVREHYRDVAEKGYYESIGE